MMGPGFDNKRLSRWLASIASTADEEIDCDALEEALETIVAAGARGEDLREILPDVAVHLDHCPECGGWYETLVELAADLEK